MSIRRFITQIFKKHSQTSSESRPINPTKPTDLEEIISGLEKRLSTLEKNHNKISIIESKINSEAEPKLTVGLNIFTLILAAMVTTIIVGGLVIINSRDLIKFANYLAYVLPIFAGMSAGIGLYVRKPKLGEIETAKTSAEALYFQVSISFLLSGLCAFFVSTKMQGDIFLNLFGFGGTVISFFSFIKNKENLRNGGTRGDRRFRPLAKLIFALNLIASSAWAAMLIFRL
ncbi:hypothetical protein ATY49_05070 [Xanthomonas oryzae pv. oryzae]|uniref:hypothetical protein n=1 Tax=Xanthomonas oryzae TaxID=347 RepID=UPI0008597712|nr:hypothetical protein [Xanthomonas oryzae]AOS30616.1 hypothetical protein ATY49_05070 [Xanthomonas oryzae pv. oryzae]